MTGGEGGSLESGVSAHHCQARSDTPQRVSLISPTSPPQRLTGATTRGLTSRGLACLAGSAQQFTGQDEFYGEQYGHTPGSSEPVTQQYYPDGNRARPCSSHTQPKRTTHFLFQKPEQNLSRLRRFVSPPHPHDSSIGLSVAPLGVCVHTVPLGGLRFQIQSVEEKAQTFSGVSLCASHLSEKL